jgi:Sec-independent protein translocase protein TatA
MGNLGAQEVIIILLLFVLFLAAILIFWVFPKFMKKLGTGVREYKEAKNNVQHTQASTEVNEKK